MSGTSTPSRKLSRTTTRVAPPSRRNAFSCNSAQMRELERKVRKRAALRLQPSTIPTLANLSGIMNQLSKERDRLHQQLSELNAALHLDGRCLLKDAPALLLPKEHVGRKQRALQKLQRNERCQPRPGAKSLRLTERGGPRS